MEVTNEKMSYNITSELEFFKRKRCFLQLTRGCEKVDCTNVHCAHSVGYTIPNKDAIEEEIIKLV